MRRVLPSNKIAFALCANAILLFAILMVITGRDLHLLPGTAAYGQLQTGPQSNGPIAIMPGQLSPNTWGCYVMDSQYQTLSVYRFDPGQPLLQLVAARDIEYDRRLGAFNTTPKPGDIKAMVERAETGPRAAPPTTSPSPEQVSP